MDSRRKSRLLTRLAGAKKRLKASYRAAYIQHAPMEPRAAVAEWEAEHGALRALDSGFERLHVAASPLSGL